MACNPAFEVYTSLSYFCVGGSPFRFEIHAALTANSASALSATHH